MKKEHPDDDGRTIVDMNVEGFRWYESEAQKRGKARFAAKTPQEKKRIFRSTYLSVVLPLICLVIGVGVAFFILYYLWL